MEKVVITNKEFTKNDYFSKCCEIVGIKVTKRQSSKFRNEKGLAWKIGRMKVKSDSQL
uniref:Uncharacterized protein n=1 Tax=viral metagenome TaxID=1070528 RepID=A0A6M3LFY5_9ZZZZ